MLFGFGACTAVQPLATQTISMRYNTSPLYHSQFLQSYFFLSECSVGKRSERREL